jgi:hypothetical protein
MDENAKELLVKGLFKFYISKMGYPEDVMTTANEIIENSVFSDAVKIGVLNYIFSKDKTYKNLSSIDDLREKVSNMKLNEIDELLSDDLFVSWLYANGMSDLAKNIILNRRNN